MSACVGGIVASIAAFQAVDPGSIPGQRIAFGSSSGYNEMLLGGSFLQRLESRLVPGLCDPSCLATLKKDTRRQARGPGSNA